MVPRGDTPQKTIGTEYLTRHFPSGSFFSSSRIFIHKAAKGNGWSVTCFLPPPVEELQLLQGEYAAVTGKKILITGGAGFIGSHVATELLRHGHHVRVMDSLIPQVHGPAQQRPDYLSDEVELMVGDVRDAHAVSAALEGVDVVYHFAARVGVGQSMYQIAEYVSVNSYGTAVLMEQLVQRKIERLVVASSMSIYGEGAYVTPDGRPALLAGRTISRDRNRTWEIETEDGTPLSAVATRESNPPNLSSVYALTKWDQEQLCLSLGRAYSIPTVALRFFNVYGPYQALSNPYTGVLAIFASRLLNGESPLINEDGEQKRDFVSVYDVARACRLALEAPIQTTGVFNVGSGQAYKIRDLAHKVAGVLECPHLAPVITGQFRSGDIRHCFADISHARDILGYEPRVDLETGMMDLAQWLRGQTAQDSVMASRVELAQRGLMV